MALEAGVEKEHVTFSSDGQGSLPVFGPDGKFVGLGVGKVASLYHEMKDAVLKEGVSLTDALMAVTQNPAMLLKLPRKGRVAEGMDGDLVLAEKETLVIDTVIAKGVVMVREGKVLVRGTFET